MPKKQKGLTDFLPPDWDDWTQEEKDDWFSYPGDKKKKKRKKKRRPTGSLAPAGIGG